MHHSLPQAREHFPTVAKLPESHCYFYRSTLTRQEDDQLFIDESSSSRATEQSQLIAKVNRINPLVKLVGATSGLMILAIAGWAVYLGLNSVQP